MLIQFTIENHRSIKERTVVSFLASKDSSLKENLIYSDYKKPLLSAIAIYGANAAGKSNVLHALKTMSDMVVGASSKLSMGQRLPWEPFGISKEPTSFEVVYLYKGIRYAYGFSFDDEGIYSEYLYYWPNGREALIFSREDGVYEFRENISEQTVLASRTLYNKLYLVSSNDWNLPQTANAYCWFVEQLTFLTHENCDINQSLISLISTNEMRARMLKELLVADLGIVDINVKNTIDNTSAIITTHRVVNKDYSTDYFQLLMSQESIGTQYFFALIGEWLKALDNGSLLVVDLIEDGLRPLLTRRLIEMIQDQFINTKGTQLLFTTHDAMLLDLSFMRRDQIWFAQKDKNRGSTELFSLSSFSPRRGENIRKGYLEGRFGAIPNLSDF